MVTEVSNVADLASSCLQQNPSQAFGWNSYMLKLEPSETQRHVYTSAILAEKRMYLLGEKGGEAFQVKKRIRPLGEKADETKT